MSKYVLKARVGFVGCEVERELNDFTDGQFDEYEDCNMSQSEIEDYELMAKEALNFEWNIEKQKD